MNEEMLIWMNRTHPGGFYCADLTNISVSDMPLEALATLETPLLLQIKLSQLQDLVGSLIEQGASPDTSCRIPDENIHGTLSNIALKTRALKSKPVFIVIAE